MMWQRLHAAGLVLLLAHAGSLSAAPGPDRGPGDPSPGGAAAPPQRVDPLRQKLARKNPASLFVIHDIYQGLTGVKRGEVKRLRVWEATARVSGVPAGGGWWNQAFLVSWQGSDAVQRVLGVVQVETDGSACFEAPPGRALCFQALDREGLLVQSMRTFVQVAPGATRACQGCHVPDNGNAPVPPGTTPMALRKAPSRIMPESWGQGFVDYPTMVQPILNRHCVGCHGGEDGIAGGLDYSGGWTWAFSLSYETLLKNTLAGFLNGENGKAKTAGILPPRTHGSGAAPLAAQLISGHHGRLREMAQSEIDLLLAWMDGNCNYHGNWDYTQHATCEAILALREPLLAELDQAGCLRCHQGEIGNDWINLAAPEFSRVLRAPMARGGDSLGLGWCRDRKAAAVRLPLVTAKQVPPDVFKPARDPAPNLEGTAVTTFPDASHPACRAMLAIIEQGRQEALKRPRVDMPGAVVVKGQWREPAGLTSSNPPAKSQVPSPSPQSGQNP